MTAPVVEIEKQVNDNTQSEGSEGPQSLLELFVEEDGSKKVAKRIIKWLEDQETLRQQKDAEWQVNKARRRGIGPVKLLKTDMNKQVYDFYAPPSVNIMPATLNKADRLCRRITSFLFTDPPMPEATPALDDDDAVDTAEVTTRILQALESEGYIDDVRTARRAFDLAHTYDSGFRHHRIDPTGGGLQPVAVLAHPAATTLEQVVPQVVDPTTGQPYGGPYATKYVAQDGSLTDDAASPNLKLQFVPKVVHEVFSGRNVLFLPSTAQDISEADGVLIPSFQRLGNLKTLYPETVGAMDEEELTQLIQQRPANTARLLPDSRVLTSQELNDDALVFTVIHYRKAGGTEPKAVVAVVCGTDYTASCKPWLNPRTGRSLDIPVDQFKQIEDEDSGYGRGMMRQLGGGNELLLMGLDAVITHMERHKARRIFLPTNSIIQAKQLQSPTKTVIPTNPGGKPEYEDVPPMPQQYFQFIETIVNELNDESNLQQTAQGLNSPSVQSGIHARQIVEQSIIALSELRQACERALIRGWRIDIQLVSAFFDTPLQLPFVGDDGQHKAKRFVGSDFRDTTNVRITKGSFTQLSPSQKVIEAERMFAVMDETGRRLISLEELKHVVLGQVGGMIGLQDDPHRQRVRRQVGVWENGPTPEWLEYQQRLQALQPALQQAQAAGAPPEVLQQLQARAGLTGPPPTPFDRLPCDLEPLAAASRRYELVRVMTKVKFLKQPPEWRQVLVAEYELMRQAAGLSTVAEQQQAAAQQAQAQQQAEAAKTQTDLQKTQIEQQGKVMTAREQARGDSAPKVSVELTGADLVAATS